MKGRVVGRRVGLVCMTVARYWLGLGMLPYAWSKMIGLQFQVPAWNYARPMGELDGRSLLWATMGYSTHFQMVMGWFEMVPAILLLVRRTRRIGALLMLPVVTNVWMLNMGLDLWQNTKVISAQFLAINILLVLYDYRAYRKFFTELLAPPERIGVPWLRTAGHVAAWVAPVVLMSYFYFQTWRPMIGTISPMAPFIGERQINRAGTWKVSRLLIDGQPVTLQPEEGMLYFDFRSRVVGGTLAHPVMASYSTDLDKRTVHIEKLQLAGSASPIDGTYRSGGDTLNIDGTRDGKPIELALQRADWGVR